MKILTLNANEVTHAISMREAIEVLRYAFAELSSGMVEMPPRRAIEIHKSAENKSSLATFMPAFLKKSNQVGIKVASLMPNNLSKNLPLIHAVILLFDIETGIPKAIINGSSLTALRTGAASGLATDLLARHDASNLAIIGSGVQARTQLEAVCEVRDIKKVKVYSRNLKNAENFCLAMRGMHKIPKQIEVCNTIHDATIDADIICTATTSQTPIIDVQNIKSGVHINAVGGHTLTTRETGQNLIDSAYVVVEQKEATFNESCEQNVTELGEIINKIKAARCDQNQITLFASVGTAIQDISVAEVVFQNALNKNLGFCIDL